MYHLHCVCACRAIQRERTLCIILFRFCARSVAGLSPARQMYKDQQEGLDNDTDTPKHDAPELIDGVLESEVVRRKGALFVLHMWRYIHTPLLFVLWDRTFCVVYTRPTFFLFCTVGSVGLL